MGRCEKVCVHVYGRCMAGMHLMKATVPGCVCCGCAEVGCCSTQHHPSACVCQYLSATGDCTLRVLLLLVPMSRVLVWLDSPGPFPGAGAGVVFIHTANACTRAFQGASTAPFNGRWQQQPADSEPDPASFFHGMLPTGLSACLHCFKEGSLGEALMPCLHQG
jgi:hypothetical protein